MHISRRKPEVKAVAGVPRESSSGSDSDSWRERCVSKVIAGRPNVMATTRTHLAMRQGLALKAPPLMKKINTMILPNRPMSDKYLQRVTMCVSYIGQPPSCGVESVAVETSQFRLNI